MKPTFKSMSRICITTGFDDTPVEYIEIAPTVKAITRNGKRYFRLDHARHQCPDGSWAGLYLWDGYGEELLRRKKASEAANAPE